MTLAPLPPPPEPTICDIHDVDARVCGGPHRVVLTDLGREVLAPSEAPIGTPKESEEG